MNKRKRKRKKRRRIKTYRFPEEIDKAIKDLDKEGKIVRLKKWKIPSRDAKK